MTDADPSPPARASRAPQTLHQFSLNDPSLHPLPEAEHLLRDLGRDPVRGGILQGTRILRGSLPHVVGIRAEPPGETFTGREGQLLDGLMAIQHARGGRYTLLGLGMHPLLEGKGGAANSQCLHIQISYGTEDQEDPLLGKILSLLPFLVAVSAASPFVEGKLEPAADNRLLRLGDPAQAGPDTVPGAGGVPDPVSLVLRRSPGCLEIRALDVQECIHSDLAMVAFLAALLRHPDPGTDTDRDAVHGLLETAIQHGTSRLQPELERLLSAAKGSATRDERRFLPVVARRIEGGSLAETLRDRSVTGEPLGDILSDLVFCLKTNLPSGMVG
ncbi:MAG: glutamate-cysteine ligase family protein [Methanomicrobiales archaeon]|nr:glutamate-cysteine ligase family protein [Methanomicrobiales archaeon]MDD1654541.1 glutamate-cysteine ligase family protein [Methanomicrobiales archaeon]